MKRILVLAACLLMFLVTGCEGKNLESVAKEAALAELKEYYGDHFEYVNTLLIEKENFEVTGGYHYVMTFKDTNEPVLEFTADAYLSRDLSLPKFYPQYKQKLYERAYGEYLLKTFKKYCPEAAVMVAPIVSGVREPASYNTYAAFDGKNIGAFLDKQFIKHRPEVLVVFKNDVDLESALQAKYETEKWIQGFSKDGFIGVDTNCLVASVPESSEVWNEIKEGIVEEGVQNDISTLIRSAMRLGDKANHFQFLNFKEFDENDYESYELYRKKIEVYEYEYEE